MAFKANKHAGTYFIVSKHSNHVLDIEGGNVKAGTKVIQWPKKGHDNANQRWTFDGEGFIHSAANANLVLDIEGGGGKGTKLIIWEKKHHDNNNQRWKWNKNGQIVNRGNKNLVLDIEGASKDGGAKLIVWEPHGNANQKFHLEH